MFVLKLLIEKGKQFLNSDIERYKNSQFFLSKRYLLLILLPISKSLLILVEQIHMLLLTFVARYQAKSSDVKKINEKPAICLVIFKSYVELEAGVDN